MLWRNKRINCLTLNLLYTIGMQTPRYHIDGNPEVIALLEKIAKDECFVETLQTRYSDSLDFHDISAAGLLTALHTAYYSGYNAGMQMASKALA